MSTSGRKTVKGATTSAPKRAKAKAVVTAAAQTVPTQEEIARRAYELYLARGGEHGHDLEDWARAEAELIRS